MFCEVEIEESKEKLLALVSEVCMSYRGTMVRMRSLILDTPYGYGF